MKVLGIETSCDETGIAIYDAEKGLVAEALYSQIETVLLSGGDGEQVDTTQQGEIKW